MAALGTRMFPTCPGQEVVDVVVDQWFATSSCNCSVTMCHVAVFPRELGGGRGGGGPGGGGVGRGGGVCVWS